MSSFAGQVIFITGAGSGIGRELARRLSEEGARIAALDRNQESLTSLRDELSGRPLATVVEDVLNAEGLREAVVNLEAELGPIDVHLASAGIGKATPATDFRPEDYIPQIEVNLIGVANSIAAVLPGMRERRKGHLVALSSLASYRGLPHMAAYCASKAGVNGLMDALRFELKEYNIDVTAICPGWIRTPLTEDITVPHPYMMEVDYAARRIIKAIRARKAYVMFPAKATWLLRLLHWLPAGLSDRLLRRRFEKLTENRAD